MMRKSCITQSRLTKCVLESTPPSVVTPFDIANSWVPTQCASHYICRKMLINILSHYARQDSGCQITTVMKRELEKMSIIVHCGKRYIANVLDGERSAGYSIGVLLNDRRSWKIRVGEMVQVDASSFRSQLPSQADIYFSLSPRTERYLCFAVLFFSSLGRIFAPKILSHKLSSDKSKILSQEPLGRAGEIDQTNSGLEDEYYGVSVTTM